MTTILDATHVQLELTARDRDEALAQIAALAARLGVTTDADAVLAELVRRESEGTTGLLDGIAIPHAKQASIVRPAMLVAGFTSPVEWESLDEQPVTRAIALMIPEDQAGTTHLRLLSKVAETLMDDDVRASLVSSTDPERIVALLTHDLEID